MALRSPKLRSATKAMARAEFIGGGEAAERLTSDWTEWGGAFARSILDWRPHGRGGWRAGFQSQWVISFVPGGSPGVGIFRRRVPKRDRPMPIGRRLRLGGRRMIVGSCLVGAGPVQVFGYGFPACEVTFLVFGKGFRACGWAFQVFGMAIHEREWAVQIFTMAFHGRERRMQVFAVAFHACGWAFQVFGMGFHACGWAFRVFGRAFRAVKGPFFESAA